MKVHRTILSYWIVRWGGTVRISGKFRTPEEAAIDCYGLSTTDMTAKSVGPRKSEFQSDSRFKSHLETKEGWVTPKRRSP